MTAHPFGYEPEECPKCGRKQFALTPNVTSETETLLMFSCVCGWFYETETKDAKIGVNKELAPKHHMTIGEYMAQRTCKNCRFWGKDNVFYGTTPVPGEWGCCESSKMMNGWHTESEQGMDVILVYTDGPSPFVSGPDFGCIHFEEKS